MPRDISRETRIHLALWRKAFKDQGLEVTLQSYSQALSMRLAMYRALKPYRENEFLDPELYEVGMKYCVGIDKDSNVLRIADRKSLLMAEDVMAQLGLTEADLLSPEEQLVESRMMQELDKLVVKEVLPDKVVPTKDNPFFERD